MNRARCLEDIKDTAGRADSWEAVLNYLTSSAGTLRILVYEISEEVLRQASVESQIQ